MHSLRKMIAHRQNGGITSRMRKFYHRMVLPSSTHASCNDWLDILGHGGPRELLQKESKGKAWMMNELKGVVQLQHVKAGGLRDEQLIARSVRWT